MCKTTAFLLFLISLLTSTTSVAQDSNDDDSELARKAGLILRRNCYRCHKGKGSESGYAFDVVDTESLVEEGMIDSSDHDDFVEWRNAVANPKAGESVPDEPDLGSEIYNAMFGGRMPPKNRPQLPKPSAEEVEIVKKWIQAGARTIPAPKARPTVTLKQELTAIRSDLQARRRDDRFNIRYLTLSHLHNDITVDDEQLATTRLALVKGLNSLSWESLLVTPKPINEQKTVYAVDISKLGWNRRYWDTLVKAYPYALSYGSLDDPELKEIDEDIDDFRSDKIPVSLRADWLIAVATKPPLYYAIMFDLKLPDLTARSVGKDPANPKQMTDLDLERYLGVNVERNIREARTWRSGFTESGVSGQNRMIERHSTKSGGFYWKSYDFKSSNRTAILTEFPLGPKFPDNEFQTLAFDHDGGEIIFSLPNGLQAYLLINQKGGRIDAGPIEVVGDSLRTSGNEQIVAGVSCIACHRVGMIESPDDEVRLFSGVVGDARDHVRRLYPDNDEFRRLLDKDRTRFVDALTTCVDNFVGDDDIAELPEPIGEVARRYHLEPMTLDTVAAELRISPARLKGALQSDPKLRRLGLRVLLREGGTIKRAAWESPAIFPLMRLAARQFGYDPKN